MPNEDKLYVNGIDGAAGLCLVAPMTYGLTASYIGRICECGKE